MRDRYHQIAIHYTIVTNPYQFSMGVETIILINN
jgi:hypothetical protein